MIVLSVSFSLSLLTLVFLASLLFFVFAEITSCEFSENLQLQLDLRVEANNLDRFNENFAKNDHVLFPHPIAPWVTEHALVESFCKGDPITKYMHDDDAGFKKAISDAGTAAVLKMIFDDNLVHGDLHPGNIFVTPDQRLVFLDAGIAVRYTDHEHEHLIDVLNAFIQYDGCASYPAARAAVFPTPPVLPKRVIPRPTL